MSTAKPLCDGFNAVDPEQRLGEQVDYLPHAAMREIDWSLASLLDLQAPWADSGLDDDLAEHAAVDERRQAVGHPVER